MSKQDDERALQLDDAEGNRVHTVWSRSGKHLIVSVARRGNWDSAVQAELTREQVAKLLDFLASRHVG